MSTLKKKDHKIMDDKHMNDNSLPPQQQYTQKKDWVFVYDGPTDDFPLGYYYYKPDGKK